MLCTNISLKLDFLISFLPLIRPTDWRGFAQQHIQIFTVKMSILRSSRVMTLEILAKWHPKVG